MKYNWVFLAEKCKKSLSVEGAVLLLTFIMTAIEMVRLGESITGDLFSSTNILKVILILVLLILFGIVAMSMRKISSLPTKR
jgi:hypothetical protein